MIQNSGMSRRAREQAEAAERARWEQEFNRRFDDRFKMFRPQVEADNANPFSTAWGGSVPTDASGRPLAPEFKSLGDPKTGLLREPYMSKSQLDTRAMESLRGEALRDPGTMSRWGQMALAQGRDQMAQDLAGQTAQARNQLAMQGGLRTGARERLASQAAQRGMMGGQQALRGIQMQDEQRRQQLLGQMPGMELQQAQYLGGIQDTNIERARNEVLQGRIAQQDQFKEAMRGWASERTAAATPSSGGKK